MFSPIKSNHNWAFYFWHRRYRRLPPSGGKQEQLNFITNKIFGLFMKFEIYWMKNASSRIISMNNVFWLFQGMCDLLEEKGIFHMQ